MARLDCARNNQAVFFCGAEVITDWKVGSPSFIEGSGRAGVSRTGGRCCRSTVGRLLVPTHWSPLSCWPAVSESYHRVSYELSELDGGILVTITQDNNATEQERNHSEQNWKMVLQGMQKLLEG